MNSDDYEWESFTCTFSKEDFENLKIFLSPLGDSKPRFSIGDQDLSTILSNTLLFKRR